MALLILIVIVALICGPVALIIAFVNAARLNQLNDSLINLRRELRQLAQAPPAPQQSATLARDKQPPANEPHHRTAAAPAAQTPPPPGDAAEVAPNTATAVQAEPAKPAATSDQQEPFADHPIFAPIVRARQQAVGPVFTGSLAEDEESRQEAPADQDPQPSSPADNTGVSGDTDPAESIASTPSPTQSEAAEQAPVDSAAAPSAAAPSAAAQNAAKAGPAGPFPGRRQQARSTANNAADGGKGLDSLEEFLGRRLLTWLGIGILFLAAAFGLHLAYEQGLLGRIFTPTVRILTLILAAAAGMAWGWRCHRQGHQPLAQGLMGGSIGLLVLAIFAASKPDLLFPAGQTLIGPITAFIALAATSGLGFALAIRLNAAALAHIALLCGLATPVLVSTGSGDRDALFGWLFMLNLGALAAAAGRNWRGLPTVAVSGTAVLLASWVGFYGIHRPQPEIGALLWFVAFQILALALPVVGSAIRKTAPEPRHLALSATSSAALLTMAWVMTAPLQGPLALLCAVFAGLQGLQVLGFFRRHALARQVGIGSALLQANLALALILGAHSLSLLWTGQALALLVNGLLSQSRLLKSAALLLLAAAALTALQWLSQVPIPNASWPMAGGWGLTWLLLPTGWGLWWIISRRWAALGETIDRHIASWLGIAAGLGWVVAVAAELLRLQHQADPAWWSAAPPFLPLLWLLLVAATAHGLWDRWQRPNPGPQPSFCGIHSGSILIALGGALTIATYLGGHGPHRGWGPIPLINPLGLWLPLAALSVFFFARRLANQQIRIVAWMMLFTAGSLETWVWAGHFSAHQQTPVWWLGALWGLWSLALLARAWQHQRPAWRAVGGALLLVSLIVLSAWAVNSQPPRSPLPVAVNLWAACLALIPILLSAAWAVGWRLNQQPDSGDRLLRQSLASAAGITWTLWAIIECLRLQQHATPPWWPDGQAITSAWLLLTSAAVHLIWERRWYGLPAPLRPHFGADACSIATIMALMASLIAVIAYGLGQPTGTIVLAHPHGLIMPAAALIIWWCHQRCRWPQLAWIAFAVALIGTTIESGYWAYHQWLDSRAGLLAITACWTLWASALLTIGLRGGSRQHRLLGLSLMGLAIAKLLIIDLGGMGANQRIVISLIVGIACLAAGAGYHRLSRRLSSTKTDP